MTSTVGLYPDLIEIGLHRQLVIMTKVPTMGTVKTRLARDIGYVSATYGYRRMLTRTVSETLRPLCWQTVLAINASSHGTDHRFIPPRTARMQQGIGDLGRRLDHVTRHTHARQIVIIGADAPDVTSADIHSAFQALNNADFVLGPATDGGFWLIGLHRRHVTRRVFSNIVWSSPSTCSDMQQNLEVLGSTMFLRQLSDCDDRDSYQRHGKKLGRRIR